MTNRSGEAGIKQELLNDCRMWNLNRILNADCREGLKELPDALADCCVTDPPYGIRFMNRKWDYEIPAVAVWQKVWRVLKPGAHLLCACGTRTQHRMAVNIEDAGFEIRDVICWHYGSGFTKSMNLSKAIDKAAGFGDVDSPVTDAAKKWVGWGTALKPATEFWTLARKPLEEKTIARNVMKFGVGGLNIDTCRISWPGNIPPTIGTPGWGGPNKKFTAAPGAEGPTIQRTEPNDLGRFPANLILDEFMAGEMDAQSGFLVSGNPVGKRKTQNKIYGPYATGQDVTGYGDSGGASRFFYVAKADSAERGPGNHHPTVKPLTLMHWLVNLVCPVEPGRIVLDPFAGSGTTCIAARQLGLDFIAFELDAGYARMAENRLRDTMGVFYDEQ